MTAAKPHIGLNLIFLVPGETGGMEVAARKLIPELIAAAPQLQFTAFINREAAAAGDGWWGKLLPAVTVPVNARSRVQWVMGEQLLLAPLARRARVDVMHSMASTAPLWGPFRRIVTVHDLIYARFPDAHAGIRDKGMRVLVPAAARRSERVIADSLSTRGDLVELLGLSPEKIDVVPLGVEPGPYPPAPPAAEIRERLGLGQRKVLLSLSAKRPHKNLEALIRALGSIAPERRPMLVIPGYSTWHERELSELALAEGVSDVLRMPGWLSPSDVEGLWGVSDAFVFPSLYEGFGLPVLEAMARGVPVACSNASSLPEVAGDAALLFDPYDESAIARAVLSLLEDPQLAGRLRDAGRERVHEFTWARSARLTVAAYERVLGRA